MRLFFFCFMSFLLVGMKLPCGGHFARRVVLDRIEIDFERVQSQFENPLALDIEKSEIQTIVVRTAGGGEVVQTVERKKDPLDLVLELQSPHNHGDALLDAILAQQEAYANRPQAW